jgi:hypothetical protein
MINVSAGMGVQFAERAKEMAETILSLGPNPLRVRNAQAPPRDAVMKEAN